MKDKNKYHYKKHTREIEYEPSSTTQSAVNAILLSNMIRDIVRQELIKFIQNDLVSNPDLRI